MDGFSYACLSGLTRFPATSAENNSLAIETVAQEFRIEIAERLAQPGLHCLILSTIAAIAAVSGVKVFKFS